MDDSNILLEITDNTATITMNDPERLNPLSRDAYHAMIDSLAEAEQAGVRCVIIEGAGDAFSSGYDIDSMGSDGRDYETLDEHFEIIQRNEHELIKRIVDFPMPVVAKIDGPAIGDAAGIALACDIPMASERARIGFSHVRVGLTMDCGVSYLLPRLVGEAKAKELALTGRVLDGVEAHNAGLVARVFPTETFDEDADEIVDDIANGPPIAMKQIKRLLSEGMSSSLDEALANEATAQTLTSASDDYAEAVRAIREDREPQFEGK